MQNTFWNKAIHIHVKGYQFNARYSLTLAMILLLSLFVALGFWQLSRAKEKQILQQHFQNRINSAPIAIEQLPENADIRYYSVRMSGSYDNAHSLLLDNKIYQHRIGYEVITPFMLQTGKAVLVNRGWIPAAKSRTELPQIPVENSQITITGRVYIPSGKAFTLGQITESGVQQWPLRLQALQIPMIEKLLNRKLYPFLVLLSSGAPQGFVRDWQPVNMPAYKHIGYATQWFTFAAVLIIIFIALGTRKLKSRQLK